MTDHIKLTASFDADTEARTIKGLAIPANATAEKGGRTWRFMNESVYFGERTPLLEYHDNTRPIGKLIRNEWTERGLEVEFKVSATRAGDEALQLAADGVLGFSVGIDVPDGGYKLVGKELRVKKAFANECSVTPTPAFAGSVVDSVSFTKDEAAMPDNNEAVEAAAARLEAAAEKIAETFAAAADRPEPQPVPRVESVKEEAPYRFDAIGGEHNFMQDAFYGYTKGEGERRERVEKFLSEKFAVDTGDINAITPNGFRRDLFVGPRPEQVRTIGGLVSHASINNNTPFAYPKWTGTFTNLVNPHTEGVEPVLGGVDAITTDTVEPEALSGKVEFNREVIDKIGAQAQGMVWNRMLVAAERAAEARLVDLLDGLTLPAGQIFAVNGTGAALSDDLDTTIFLELEDLDRYGSLAAVPALYKALYTARDADGRKLFPPVGASNADGTVRGRSALDMNGVIAIQSRQTDSSYLIDASTVVQWLSTPRRLDFDIQVKSVYMGFWQYSAEAVLDLSGVIRVNYTA